MLALLCAVWGIAEGPWRSPGVLQTAAVAVDSHGALNDAPKDPSQSSTIPRQIFLTTKTSDLSEQEASQLAKWRKLNPGYSVELFNDTRVEEMMRTGFPDKPDVYRVFRTLPLGVMKADLWRYAVLLLRGGIYVDMDMEDLQPMDVLLEGVESGCRNVLLFANSGAGWFSQAFLAAEPGTELLAHVIDKVVQRVLDDGGVDFRKHGTDAHGHAIVPTVLYYTGPPMWTDAISEVAGLPQRCPAGGPRALCMVQSVEFAQAGLCVPDATDLTSKVNLMDGGSWVVHHHMNGDYQAGHWVALPPPSAGDGASSASASPSDGSSSAPPDAGDGFYPLVPLSFPLNTGDGAEHEAAARARSRAQGAKHEAAEPSAEGAAQGASFRGRA